MKKIIILIFVVFISSKFSYAQRMQYSIFSEPYTELYADLPEQPMVKYDSGFRVYKTLPFTFLFNEIVAQELDVYGPAYANLIDYTDTVNWFIELVTFYPFRSELLVDKSIVLGVQNNLSKLSTKTDYLNGEKIFKVQWKNMGFKGCSPNDSLNMQLWIFERSNKAQFRYGKSNMTSLNVLNTPDTPIIAVEVETLNEIYYATCNGSGNSYTWLDMNVTGRSMGIPTEGTVIEIRSTESPVFVEKSKVENNLILKRSSSNIVVISKDKKVKINKIKVVDLNSKELIVTNTNLIETDLLSSGMYVLIIEKSDGIVFEKFFK